MKIKSGRKMDIKFSSKLENIYLNEGTYNLLIGAIVLYGLLINLITCAFFGDYVAKIPVKVLLIGYLIIAIIGIAVLTFCKSIILKFIGYNMLIIPCGVTLSTTLNDYVGKSDIVLEALIITTIITVCMVILSSVFPKFFLGIGRMLFVALLGIIIAYIVCFFADLNSGIVTWISAIVFSLYIGHDFVSAQHASHNVANAIIFGADIYLDLINLFVDLLAILKDND